MKQNETVKFKFDYFPKKILKHWEHDHKVKYVNILDKEESEYKITELMSYSFDHLKKDRMAFLLIDTNLNDKHEVEFLKIVAIIKEAIKNNTQSQIQPEDLNKVREFIFASFLRQSVDNPDVKHTDYDFVPSGVQMVAQFYKISPVSRNIEPIWNTLVTMFKKMNFIGFKNFQFDIPLLNPPVIKSNWKDNKGDFMLMPFDKNFVVILSTVAITEDIMPTDIEWNGFFTHAIMKDPRVLGYVPTQHFEIKIEEIKKLTKKEQIEIAMKAFKEQMELKNRTEKELAELEKK